MTTKNCANGPKLVLKDLCEKSFVRNVRLPFILVKLKRLFQSATRQIENKKNITNFTCMHIIMYKAYHYILICLLSWICHSYTCTCSLKQIIMLHFLTGTSYRHVFPLFTSILMGEENALNLFIFIKCLRVVWWVIFTLKSKNKVLKDLT